MFADAFVAAVLRSPLHGLISNAVMLVTVKGRRSGRVISTPVNFVRDRESLWAVSQPDRQWWRNLRGGAPVTLRLAGRNIATLGTALETSEDAARGLAHMVKWQPALRTRLGLPSPKPQTPDPDLFLAAKPGRIVVRFDLAAGEAT